MRYCFALDLKNDETLIAEYEEYHQRVWPEILESITGLIQGTLELLLPKDCIRVRGYKNTLRL